MKVIHKLPGRKPEIFLGNARWRQRSCIGPRLLRADLDEGPIIEQEVARVDHSDGPEDLAAIGRDAERVALARAVRWHAEHRVLLHGRRTVIFR